MNAALDKTSAELGGNHSSDAFQYRSVHEQQEQRGAELENQGDVNGLSSNVTR